MSMPLQMACIRGNERTDRQSRNDRHYTRAGDGPSGDVALARIQGERIV